MSAYQKLVPSRRPTQRRERKRRGLMPRVAHVYVITDDDGFVKVGLSSDPERRLFALQTSHPRTLRLAYKSPEYGRAAAHFVERSAHVALGDFRCRGEWFRCSVETALAVLGEIKVRPL